MTIDFTDNVLEAFSYVNDKLHISENNQEI